MESIRRAFEMINARPQSAWDWLYDPSARVSLIVRPEHYDEAVEMLARHSPAAQIEVHASESVEPGKCYLFNRDILGIP